MRTCWQIRQALSSLATDASSVPDSPPATWVLQCAECAVYASGVSCWEQHHGSQPCCAPVHLTCDFCVLYIEHRREVTTLIQSTEPPAPRSDAERRNYPEGGPSVIMEKLQLNIPNMWADHHVPKVRAVLTRLDGLEDVYASAAWKQALVSYDPAKTDLATIKKALAEAGYPVDGEGVPMLVQPSEKRRDPQWKVLGARVTVTNQADVEMSGEFRKY